MKFSSLLTLLLFTAFPTLQALEIQGLQIAPEVSVAGQKLKLNGAGLRTVTLLIIPIKAYVAAFYAPLPLQSESAVIASSGPMVFDFNFLTTVAQCEVTCAWNTQFERSASHTYPGYERDRDAFIALFGSLKKGDLERVQLIGTNTLVSDCGVLKGIIPGRNFQRAFLSLWFGSRPVQSDLKNALLGIQNEKSHQP